MRLKKRELWILFVIFISGCKKIDKNIKEEDIIQMEVRDVVIDSSGNPVVILENAERTKRLPIWIGFAEARAILMEIQKIQTPRPMTHDLLKNILTALGASIKKVVINDIKGSTFYAQIYIQRHSASYIIDARPSDAIALSLRTSSPIFVRNEVIEKSGIKIEEGGRILYSKKLGVFFQELEPMVAEALGVEGGIAVTEVEEGGFGERIGLKPGDLILQINSKDVMKFDEIEAILASEELKSITVLRGEEKIELNVK